MKENIIVLISHNSASLVVESISAIGEQHSFCVIENGDDRSLQKLKDFKEKSSIAIEVHHIENRGFGSACNFAARLHPAANLLFLNPDCLISSDDIDLLFERLDENPGSVVAPVVFDHNTKAVQNYRREWTGKWTVVFMWLNLGRFRKAKAEPETFDSTPPLWVAGSAFAINAKKMLELGGFDENFFLYFEEEDLFRRLVSAGGQCLIVDEAKAVHEAGTSTSVRKSNIREFMLISGLYYVKKWHGKRAWSQLKIVCRFLLLTRISDFFMPSADRSALIKCLKQS